MANLGYLIAAYLALWIGLFAYLFWIGNSLRNAQTELRELRAALAQREREATVPAAPVTPRETTGSPRP